MKDTTRLIHEKAKTLAQDYLRTEGDLLSVLMEMRRQRLFAELNYSGIFDYCERALNLSRAQAYYFKTVSDASEKVPELKEAVVQGELTLSEARRIAPVITTENQEHWIERAKTLNQTDLEKAVTEANPKAHAPKDRIRPVAKNLSELKVSIDEKTQENIKMLQEVLSQKMGKAATLAEVIAWATNVTREKFDPAKKAERARISLGNSSQTRPEEPLIRTETHRRPVKISIKHQVIQRDGLQCSYLGHDGRRCEQKRWLRLHHIKEVAKGGTNIASNLRLMCSSHHAFTHRP